MMGGKAKAEATRWTQNSRLHIDLYWAQVNKTVHWFPQENAFGKHMRCVSQSLENMPTT